MWILRDIYFATGTFDCFNCSFTSAVTLFNVRLPVLTRKDFFKIKKKSTNGPNQMYSALETHCCSFTGVKTPQKQINKLVK